MKRQNLNDFVTELRETEPDDVAVREAARRVFRHVFDAAYLPERVQRIRGCADFEALIPAYLDNSLSAARVALLEDHVSDCVECRRAVREAREGKPRYAESTMVPRRRPWLAWGLAASLAAGTAIGITGAFNGLLPGQHAVRATVESVEGTLYRMNGLGASLLEVHAVVRNAEELRTAKGSRAIFRLLDGAQIEMDERSHVSVSRSWRGTSVEIESGRVIVRPAVSSPRTLTVAAGDVRIPVSNAVFAVERGTKGSRVAVAKGSARIEQGGQSKQIDAGRQFVSDLRLKNVSLEGEFAWSKDANYYLGLLKELSTLQKQLQEIPSPNLRFSSNLAQYLPANTVIYAAIPNMGDALSEAKHIFDQRLGESEVLRDWWQQQPVSRNGAFDRALEQMSAISQYLGDEIVLAVTETGPHSYAAPVFLAEVRRAGLQEYLNQNLPAAAKSLFVFVDGRRVIASTDAAEVKSVEQALGGATASGFTKTPFYARVLQSYSSGAGYLLAADMEQIVAKSVSSRKGVPSGFNNVQYLVLERRGAPQGQSETRAALSFAGGRQGVASWIGAPGPMGSLDFVSPDANLAVSVVMKNPLTVVQELIAYATQANPSAAQGIRDLQDRLGVLLTDDLAAPLGGDATFAIDGPLVPIPAWRLAIEVYDPTRLQHAIATLVQHLGQDPESRAGKLQLTSQELDSRTFYMLKSDKMPGLAAYYTFVDGYLVAGPSEASLIQAIQNRETGYTLVTSPLFQRQLPSDKYTNFSAVVWHNAGKSLEAVASQVKANGSLSSRGQSLAALLAGAGPGLICVYGEPDRVVAASKGDFLGFNLGSLAGLGEGRSLPWVMASRQVQ